MTPEVLLSKVCDFPTPIDSSREVLPPQSPLSRLGTDDPLDTNSEARSISPRRDETEHWLLYQEQRRAALDHTLRKLCGLDLPGKERVEAYLHNQYRRHLSPNTLRNTFTAIRGFLEFVKEGGKDELDKVTREDIEGYIEHDQDRGVKPSTIDMRMRSLRAFFRFLIDRGALAPEMLLKKVKIKVPEALPRAMDPDDVKRLIKVLTDTRDRAMVLVLLRTGMRIGELLHTLVSEVSVKERKIEIYEAQKTQVGRVVYLSEDAVVALKAWLRKRESQKKYLIYTRGRPTMSYPAARMMFLKCLAKAGLLNKGYTLHCLRHTFATELLNAGMRLECLQQLLGHESVEMTRRYAKLTDKTREEEYFRAMAIIERRQADGCDDRCDRPLQALLEEEELLSSHRQELHEHA
jgi:integrase/recombinase XerD